MKSFRTVTAHPVPIGGVEVGKGPARHGVDGRYVRSKVKLGH